MALIKVNKRLELRFWIVVFSVVFIGASNSVYCQAPTLTTPADRSIIFPTDDDAVHNVSFSWSSTGASSYKKEIVSEVGFNWGQPADRTFTGITDTSYYVASGGDSDAAGNTSTTATQYTWTYDSTSPSITITAVDGSSASLASGTTTNERSITLTFTTNESTTDFVISDIAVTNGSLTNFSGSGTTYTASLTPSDDGLVTVDVASGVFTDAAGNANSAATQFSFTFEAVDYSLNSSEANLSASLVGKKINFAANNFFDTKTEYNQVSINDDGTIISITNGVNDAYSNSTRMLRYSAGNDNFPFDWDYFGGSSTYSSIGSKTADAVLSSDGLTIFSSRGDSGSEQTRLTAHLVQYPNEDYRGWVIFDIPDDEELKYNQSGIGNQIDPTIKPRKIALSGDGLTGVIADDQAIGDGQVQFFYLTKDERDQNPGLFDSSFGFTSSLPNPGDVGDQFGGSVSLNHDGTILAVGSPDSSSSPGYVSIFKLESSVWTKKLTISGDEIGDRFGASISLSDDGYTLAVGAPNHNSNKGQVKIYNIFNGQSWTESQLGSDLDGLDDYTSSGGEFGSSVSLSGNGRILAASAPSFDTATRNEGLVEVFQLYGSSWNSILRARPWDLFNKDNVSIPDYRNVPLASYTSNSKLKDQYFGYTVSLSKNGQRFIAGTDIDAKPDGIYGYAAVVNTGADFSSPTLSSLTYSGSDLIVKQGDTEVITATFSEVMSAPTITIGASGGSPTTATMSLPSDGITDGTVWEYSWDVPSGDDDTLTVSVSGTDLAGNAYSGSDSLSFALIIQILLLK